MRFLKLAIISILVLFLLLTALGLLLPSVVRVTRSITIRTSSDTIHGYISDVKKWPLWMESISAGSLSFTSPQTQGKNTSAHIGNLWVHVIKEEKNTTESVWKSASGKEQLCVFQLQSDSAVNTTSLNWYFEQKLHWYPWERLPAIANDKVMGPFMEQSLDKLKALAEKDNN